MGIPPKNILYINFEIEKFSFITNKLIFAETIEIYLKKTYSGQGKIYLYFVEIEGVPELEKVVASYLADTNIDVEIFITGSNSNMLCSELSTYLGGRYITKTIYPTTNIYKLTVL